LVFVVIFVFFVIFVAAAVSPSQPILERLSTAHG